MPTQEKPPVVEEVKDFATPTKAQNINKPESPIEDDDDDQHEFQDAEEGEEGDEEFEDSSTFQEETDPAEQTGAKPKMNLATPAAFKRRQAASHLVINSPTDHIFSPISSKLLHKKKHLKD